MSPVDISEPFGWPIIIYLTLAGISCGAALSALWFSRSESMDVRAVVSPALWLAAAAVGLGSILLIGHLGVPADTYLLFTKFNPASAVAWGVRIITIFVLICVFAAFFYRKEDPGSLGIITKVLLLILALAVGIYPAFVLSQGTAHPFWSSPLLVPLFLLAGCHSGFAIVQLMMPRKWLSDVAARIRMLDFAFVGLSIVLFAAFFFSVPVSSEALNRVLAGELALWFWGGLVVVGWLLPLFLNKGRSTEEYGSIVARQFLFLFGALALRAVVVLGGQGSIAFIGA